jgi:acetolactate synthase-1/2/3 large subunit
MLQRAADLLSTARRPVLYGGGGLINSGPAACEAFTQLVRRLHAPCTLTLMGLGAFPASDPKFIGMLGMHGMLEANLAMHEADLVVCVGARFDDRVTGKLDEFCPHARKIHIDIDPGSINKVVKVDVPMVGDCGAIVEALLALLPAEGLAPERLAPWWQRIERWRAEDCLGFEPRGDAILPQQLMSSLQRAMAGATPSCPPTWASTRCGPRNTCASTAAALAHLRRRGHHGLRIAGGHRRAGCAPGGACRLRERRCLGADEHPGAFNRGAASHAGEAGALQQRLHGHGAPVAGAQPRQPLSHSWNEALPDFVALAKAFGWGARRVSEPAELEAALAECLASEGPFFLDVQVARRRTAFR